MTLEQIIAALKSLSTLDRTETTKLAAAIRNAYCTVRGLDPETGDVLDPDAEVSAEDQATLASLDKARAACQEHLATLPPEKDDLAAEIAKLDASFFTPKDDAAAEAAAKAKAEKEAAEKEAADKLAADEAAAKAKEEEDAAAAAKAAAAAEAAKAKEEEEEEEEDPLELAAKAEKAKLDAARELLEANGHKVKDAAPAAETIAAAKKLLEGAGMRVEDEAAAEQAAAEAKAKAALELKLNSRSGTPNMRRRVVPQHRQGKEAANAKSKITILGEGTGKAIGAEVTLADAFGALVSKRQALMGTRSSGIGTGVKYPVARIHALEGEFKIDARVDGSVDPHKLDEVDKEAVADFLERSDEVVASGGCCVVADREFGVDLMVDGNSCFRDNFPRVQTPRGAVEYYPELCFDRANAGDIQALNVFSCEDDAANYPIGSGGVLPAPTGVAAEFADNYPLDLSEFQFVATTGIEGKGPCAVLPCITTKMHDTLLWTKCHDFGNWQSLLFPEFTRAWTELADTYHEVSMDEAYLAEYIAQSQLITPSPLEFGATRTTLMRIVQIMARFRNTYRLPASARFRLIVPTYFLSILQTDLANEMSHGDNFSNFRVTENDVAQWLGDKGVNLGLYCDNAGTTTQGDETVLSGLCDPAGAITDLAWPGSVRLLLHVEGEWIDRFTGEFDFGIIRDWNIPTAPVDPPDTARNAGTSMNNFRMFSEEIRRLNRKSECCRSFVIDLPVCASGVGAGGVIPDPASCPL